MVLEYISGNKIDREKWDRCIDQAVNGNICAYSWFLDIMCRGWDGIVADDYVFVMPLAVGRSFGIHYLLQPRFIQQWGVFGLTSPDRETVSQFIEALPESIRVVDYHFNEQNILPHGQNAEMRTNFLLKLDKPYEDLRMAYSHNLVRNLKKSGHSGFHVIQHNDPDPLIRLFREVKGRKYDFLTDENFRRLSRVIKACLNKGKAKVWSVYDRENALCGGIVWLYSHGRAVLYFSAQSKKGKDKGALAWLIDAFICENASSDLVLDFEGSVQPGLARFYGSFGSVGQGYTRLKMNNLPPFLKMAYSLYRKIKKD